MKIELEPGGLRREYVPRRRGAPEIWPVREGGKTFWRCRNLGAFEMAAAMREIQTRLKARKATPETRKARMKAQIAKRMTEMQARGYAPARDISREQKTRQRFYIEPIRVRQY